MPADPISQQKFIEALFRRGNLGHRRSIAGPGHGWAALFRQLPAVKNNAVSLPIKLSDWAKMPMITHAPELSGLGAPRVLRILKGLSLLNEIWSGNCWSLNLDLQYFDRIKNIVERVNLTPVQKDRLRLIMVLDEIPSKKRLSVLARLNPELTKEEADIIKFHFSIRGSKSEQLAEEGPREELLWKIKDLKENDLVVMTTHLLLVLKDLHWNNEGPERYEIMEKSQAAIDGITAMMGRKLLPLVKSLSAPEPAIRLQTVDQLGELDQRWPATDQIPGFLGKYAKWEEDQEIMVREVLTIVSKTRREDFPVELENQLHLLTGVADHLVYQLLAGDLVEGQLSPFKLEHYLDAMVRLGLSDVRSVREFIAKEDNNLRILAQVCSPQAKVGSAIEHLRSLKAADQGALWDSARRAIRQEISRQVRARSADWEPTTHRIDKRQLYAYRGDDQLSKLGLLKALYSMFIPHHMDAQFPLERHLADLHADKQGNLFILKQKGPADEPALMHWFGCKNDPRREYLAYLLGRGRVNLMRVVPVDLERYFVSLTVNLDPDKDLVTDDPQRAAAQQLVYSILLRRFDSHGANRDLVGHSGVPVIFDLDVAFADIDFMFFTELYFNHLKKDLDGHTARELDPSYYRREDLAAAIASFLELRSKLGHLLPKAGFPLKEERRIKKYLLKNLDSLEADVQTLLREMRD